MSELQCTTPLMQPSMSNSTNNLIILQLENEAWCNLSIKVTHGPKYSALFEWWSEWTGESYVLLIVAAILGLPKATATWRWPSYFWWLLYKAGFTVVLDREKSGLRQDTHIGYTSMHCKIHTLIRNQPRENRGWAKRACLFKYCPPLGGNAYTDD